MKQWFKQKKVYVWIVLTALTVGVGTFCYYAYQQHYFEQETAEKQELALKTMEQKEAHDTNQQAKKMSNPSDKKDAKKAQEQAYEKAKGKQQFSVDSSKVDYSGKDVKPLTVKSMEKVNAVKVIQSVGVGTIEIPRIGLKLPILEGISQENLSVGAGTMKAGQVLKQGNFVLAGHYMTDRGLLFGGIQQVKVGDQIVITYQSEQATYQVTETKVISKDDGYVTFDSEGDGILTLLTCDRPVVHTPNRFMVRAVCQ
ncbi:TPA: class A sortase [Enterococcus faecium]